MTKDELEAQNVRLGAEVAALRTLLAAVRDLADVPMPADYDDMQEHYLTCARRVDMIAVYADPESGSAPAPAVVLHDRAEALRQEAARPLRYTPKAAAPALAIVPPAADQ